MKVGDLVIINRSYSRKAIGKLAIVLKVDPFIMATIHIVDSGEEEDYDIRKLVIYENR